MSFLKIQKRGSIENSLLKFEGIWALQWGRKLFGSIARSALLVWPKERNWKHQSIRMNKWQRPIQNRSKIGTCIARLTKGNEVNERVKRGFLASKVFVTWTPIRGFSSPCSIATLNKTQETHLGPNQATIPLPKGNLGWVRVKLGCVGYQDFA